MQQSNSQKNTFSEIPYNTINNNLIKLKHVKIQVNPVIVDEMSDTVEAQAKIHRTQRGHVISKFVDTQSVDGPTRATQQLLEWCE